MTSFADSGHIIKRTRKRRNKKTENCTYIALQNKHIGRKSHKIAVKLIGKRIGAVLTHGVAEDSSGITELLFNRDRFIIKVCANERSTEASVYTSDYDTDLAVLRLDSSISGCKALPILSSSTLTSSDDCYSLGYSSTVTQYSDPSEVITHHGVFKRIETLDGVEYVISSMDLSSGNAGGPLVDENGSVIGVLAGQMADNSDNMECYAISSDSLMDILDQSGTPYRNADGGNSSSGFEGPENSGSGFPSWGGAAPGGFKRLP